MSETTPVKPTYVRYNAVLNFLSKEPAFAEYMAPATVEIVRRDGTTCKISEQVAKFTQSLCERGLDPAVKLSKAEILNLAAEYFKLSLSAVLTSASGAKPAETTVVDGATPTSTAAPAPAKQPLSRSLAVLVLLSSANELASQDNEPGAAERAESVKLALEKYRRLHGL
jgi:hypothetical protein